MAEHEINQMIAKKLNYYLDRNGKSQVDLADYIGVSQATISNWCKGIKLPRMDKIDRICAFFSINRSDLIEDKFAGENGLYYLNDKTRQIAQAVFENPELGILFNAAKDIPPKRLKAYIDFMKSLTEQEHGDNDTGC